MKSRSDGMYTEGGVYELYTNTVQCNSGTEPQQTYNTDCSYVLPYLTFIDLSLWQHYPTPHGNGFVYSSEKTIKKKNQVLNSKSTSVFTMS